MARIAYYEELDLSTEFIDRRGKPAAIDGIPEWFTDNTDLLGLTPSDDGRSCVVAAIGPLGKAMVTLTADADTGEGTEALIGTIEIEVTAGRATRVELKAGPPREQTEDDGLDEIAPPAPPVPPDSSNPPLPPEDFA